MGANRQRAWIWGLSAALGLGSAFGYGSIVSSFDDPTAWRIVFFALMGLAMLGLVAGAPRWRSERLEWTVIALLALALRAALLPTPATDDVHRYLWEGRLVLEGLSPYSARGDSLDWVDQRDEQWERMNNKDKLTAYPPATMLMFAAAAWVGYKVWVLKLLFVSAELLALFLVACLLRRRGLPARSIGWAAFNPVMLVSYAGEGHFDALMLAALAWAVLAVERRFFFWAGVALALAMQIKVVAVIGLPWLILRGKGRALIGFALAAAVVSLPFLGSLDGLWAGVRDFGSQRWFNGPLYTALEWLGVRRESLWWLLPSTLAFALLVRLWARGARESLDGHWQWLAGALLLASPTVHFWYLSWLVILLPLRPSLWWVSLSVSQAFYFLVWKNAATGPWNLEPWQSALVWLPALCLVVPGLGRGWEAWRASLSRVVESSHSKTDGQLDWLVVVPTFNAAGALAPCLHALLPQLEASDKLVVVDAGSTDETVEIAKRMAVHVVFAERGRGNQILAGLEAQASKYALIVHADAVASPELMASLRKRVASGDGAVGGSCGQRFAESGIWPYRLVEALNELRAGLVGISFGDQMQYFDRRVLADARFPGQPLMEDVELSARLRALGSVDYLGRECVISGAKWRRAPRRRFVLVLGLVARYGWARLFRPDRVRALAEEYYRAYYGPRK